MVLENVQARTAAAAAAFSASLDAFETIRHLRACASTPKLGEVNAGVRGAIRW
jgi:hypothetical protein